MQGVNGFLSQQEYHRGSILGPSLFNVFINDMYMFINKHTLHNYADENFFSCAAAEVEEVTSSLKMDGGKFVQWFTDNGIRHIPVNFSLW